MRLSIPSLEPFIDQLSRMSELGFIGVEGGIRFVRVEESTKSEPIDLAIAECEAAGSGQAGGSPSLEVGEFSRARDPQEQSW